ncbi:hypothetical protein KP79_PYT06387 [Mizuhopecten yessoensis]|uniref:Uncharacterized protein n=3 Tax=Mizuhopecten yessoensis TaxID=6573 RepID=A0A210QX11_MIZYE|nr:hypothetical protein KP79_PYT06387 [Mizuhopecten yessoensis]
MAESSGVLALATLLTTLALGAGAGFRCNPPSTTTETIYDYVLPDILGQRNISLSAYKGKVVNIMNVATY